MKKQVLFLAALVFMMLHTVSTSADDRVITFDQLPKAARQFVQTHFPGKHISYATVDADFLSKTYEVHLNNGAEIEFDKNGNWDKVDCHHAAVPAAIIPASIANYVKANFPDSQIVKIDKERGGYDIELSNDLDLKFNAKGKFLGIDD